MKWLKDWWNEKQRLRDELVAARALRDARFALVEQERDNAKMKAAKIGVELEDALCRLSSLSRPRVVKVPERALGNDELLDALAVDSENELWRAVHQLLDQQIADAVDLTAKKPEADPRSGMVVVTPEVRTFHAGGVDHLREFQALLLDWQAKARKREADEDRKEDKD